MAIEGVTSDTDYDYPTLPYSELLRQLSSYYETHPLGLVFTGNKVGIEPIFDPDTSAGGIIIPEQAKGRCAQGIIKFIGRGCTSDLSIGDYVIFSGYDGDLVRFEDTLTIVLPESNIQGIVKALPENFQEKVSQLAASAPVQVDMRNKLESRSKV